MSVVYLKKLDIGKIVRTPDYTYEKEEKIIDAYNWFCEGCGFVHDFWMDGRWTFNGDLDRPTFYPSLLLKQEAGWAERCHSFVENGEVKFLSDCSHHLAGKTLKLLDVEEWTKPRLEDDYLKRVVL